MMFNIMPFYSIEAWRLQLIKYNPDRSLQLSQTFYILNCLFTGHDMSINITLEIRGNNSFRIIAIHQDDMLQFFIALVIPSIDYILITSES